MKMGTAAKPEMKMIAEGVNTTKSIYQIAKQNSLDMPICTETYNILFKGKNPKAAISELMQRKLINE